MTAGPPRAAHKLRMVPEKAAHKLTVVPSILLLRVVISAWASWIAEALRRPSLPISINCMAVLAPSIPNRRFNTVMRC